jgi:hypothetical protein
MVSPNFVAFATGKIISLNYELCASNLETTGKLAIQPVLAP